MQRVFVHSEYANYHVQWQDDENKDVNCDGTNLIRRQQMQCLVCIKFDSVSFWCKDVTDLTAIGARGSQLVINSVVTVIYDLNIIYCWVVEERFEGNSHSFVD